MVAARVPFPSVLDSTILAAFRSCPQKAWLEFFLHYKMLNQSVHLHAGAAYAKGMEVTRKAFYINGRSPDEAIAAGVGGLLKAYGNFDCPADSAKSAERTAGALEFYFSHYRLGEDKAIPLKLPGDRSGIEFSFLEPIDVLHPESGDPLLLSGRFDMLCEFEGMKLGEDDKTASQLGASWPRQWDLRSQFTNYTWGAARAGIKLDGFLVRGVSILKTKYDTLQAITYRPQWMLDRGYEQLCTDAKRMIQAWKEQKFDYNLDHACAEYGGCPFREVCLMREPAALLSARYERRKWDPIKRIETVLAEGEF